MDPDLGTFSVRAMAPREAERNVIFVKNMLFASVAASLAIVGLGAYFITLFA